MEGDDLMSRRKKDGRFINYYIDRSIYERLQRFAEDKSQQMTTALERILDDYLTRYEAETAMTVRYCPHCHLLVRDTRCPACGKKWLEEPKSDDYCYLIERDSLWAGVFEDCLRQNEIPYLTQNTMGAGLTAKIGSMFETVKFYVKYAYYVRAEELAEELFAADRLEDTEADA